MANTYEMFSVRVTDVEHATPLIKRFTLAREDGAPMPDFTGGSHVIVQMQGADGSQFSNAYSLMSDPRDTRSYQIGVRLEEQSKGGSAFMHQQVLLDHYGAQDPAEFFSVATEAFFEQGAALRSYDAALYRELQGYFKVDPSSW